MPPAYFKFLELEDLEDIECFGEAEAAYTSSSPRACSARLIPWTNLQSRRKVLRIRTYAYVGRRRSTSTYVCVLV